MEKVKKIDEEIKQTTIQLNSIDIKLKKYQEKLIGIKKEKSSLKLNNKIDALQFKFNETKIKLNNLEKSKIQVEKYVKNMSLIEHAKNILKKTDDIIAYPVYDTQNFIIIKQIFEEIDVSFKKMENRLQNLEINNPSYIINEFIKDKKIYQGSVYHLSIKDIQIELNRWYNEKYSTNCICVFDELMIRYFVVNGYNVIYPQLSRYWRYDTIGMTVITFSMYQ